MKDFKKLSKNDSNSFIEKKHQISQYNYLETYTIPISN